MNNEHFHEFVVKYLMNLTERMAALESAVLRIEKGMDNKILLDIHQQHQTGLDGVEKKHCKST